MYRTLVRGLTMPTAHQMPCKKMITIIRFDFLQFKIIIY